MMKKDMMRMYFLYRYCWTCVMISAGTTISSIMYFQERTSWCVSKVQVTQTYDDKQVVL